MPEQGNDIIISLRKKWRTEKLLSLAFLALSAAIVIAAILYLVSGVSFWLVLIYFPLISMLLMSFNRSWRITDEQVARLLDHSIPELQESSTLFLKPPHERGFLESLQVTRIGQVMAGAEKPKPYRKDLRTSLILFFGTLLLSIGLLQMRSYFNAGSGSDMERNPVSGTKKEVLPATVSSVNINITPPAYTGRLPRTEQRLNLEVEAGSRILWKFITSQAADKLELVFNDSVTIPAKPGSDSKTVWELSSTIKSPAFYQVKVNGKSSDYYKLECIKDKEPVIIVKTPAAHSSIDFGERPVTKLQTHISDDYGIKQASLVATIASGKGEAVKFKEQKIPFNTFVAGGTQYELQQSIDLSTLGMVPGDELYFFVSATDNFQQETRSDIYTVKIEDTAELMSMEGLISGVDLKPEFFRSQRQIIIETEQLIKSRASMSEQDFKEKSNDLGNDQKLLRLRYGKFLGEEAETEIGGEQHGDEEHEETKPEDFGNAEKIADPYTHKHDIAEDATFFDPETKKQLKATLNEMWDAELRLRTFKPGEALPYEYKALRLLKELQQQSRVYVAKTNTRVPPLKPEKRLSGELDGITEPKAKKKYEPASDPATTIRKALGIMEELKNDAVITAGGEEILSLAGQQLTALASTEPSIYLPALEALKKIRNGELTTKNIRLVENSFNRMLKNSSRQPYAAGTTPASELSREYFINLNKKGERP
jgi:hypothetical protein